MPQEQEVLHIHIMTPTLAAKENIKRVSGLSQEIYI